MWHVPNYFWSLPVTVFSCNCIHNPLFKYALVILQSESPLMIRPFIKDMTRSELHAVCTGGFATIAGSVMAAYIEMGVSVI